MTNPPPDSGRIALTISAAISKRPALITSNRQPRQRDSRTIHLSQQRPAAPDYQQPSAASPQPA